MWLDWVVLWEAGVVVLRYKGQGGYSPNFYVYVSGVAIEYHRFTLSGKHLNHNSSL